MAQIVGSELAVGQSFTTIDKLGGVVVEIVPLRKGARRVFTDQADAPYYIFDNETLDVPDD